MMNVSLTISSSINSSMLKKTKQLSLILITVSIGCFLECHEEIPHDYHLNTTGFNELGFIYLNFTLIGYGKMAT